MTHWIYWKLNFRYWRVKRFVASGGWVHPGGWHHYPMLTRRQRALQRVREAWWILTGKHSLHRAWQIGHDQGIAHEYQRVVVNGGR